MQGQDSPVALSQEDSWRRWLGPLTGFFDSCDWDCAGDNAGVLTCIWLFLPSPAVCCHYWRLDGDGGGGSGGH